jgi:hypothetical protein
MTAMPRCTSLVWCWRHIHAPAVSVSSAQQPPSPRARCSSPSLRELHPCGLYALRSLVPASRPATLLLTMGASFRFRDPSHSRLPQTEKTRPRAPEHLRELIVQAFDAWCALSSQVDHVAQPRRGTAATRPRGKQHPSLRHFEPTDITRPKTIRRRCPWARQPLERNTHTARDRE